MGMCGPIAFILPVKNKTTLGKITGLLSYNFGRVFTYSLLGLLIGIFGEGLRLVGVSQVVSIALGAVLIIYVIVSKKYININIHNKYYIKFNSAVKAKLSGLLKKQSNASLFFTGLLNGFIPCGVVFIAMQAALIQNSLLNSILFMAVFGIGTIPMMFGLSMLSNSFPKKISIKINKVMPFLTVIVALLLIVRGMNLNIPYISPSYNVEQHEMACCHKPTE